MKQKIRIVLCVLITASLSFAEEREWTDSKSGKTIKGELVDKRADGSAILVKLANGKEHWIKLDRLSAEDQEYAAEWIKPFEYLKVVYEKDEANKVIGLKVVATAKDENIAFMATPKIVKNGEAAYTFFSIDPGESRTVELQLDRDYEVTITNRENKELAKKELKKVSE